MLLTAPKLTSTVSGTRAPFQAHQGLGVSAAMRILYSLGVHGVDGGCQSLGRLLGQPVESRAPASRGALDPHIRRRARQLLLQKGQVGSPSWPRLIPRNPRSALEELMDIKCRHNHRGDGKMARAGAAKQALLSSYTRTASCHALPASEVKPCNRCGQQHASNFAPKGK